MRHVIKELPGLISMINGVAFHQALDVLSISEHIENDELLEQFLAVPGYRLAEDEEIPDAIRVKVETKPETSAQKKAREKAEKAEAEKLAAEEAANKQALEDEAAKLLAEAPAADAETEDDTGEVF